VTRARTRGLLLVALCALARVGAAQEPAPAQEVASLQDPVPPSESEEAPAALGATAELRPAAPEAHQASSRVSRRELDERQPRSTPDALRYEPGVSVQQTAHGQGSAYVRGMTGQQVVHLFDGVRINHGLFRQGPNQYFFTIDGNTLDRLEVVRGSASTVYGSDALGGAILALPREPALAAAEGFAAHPALFGRFASADLERGGRAELELSLGRDTALLLGGGYRHLDRLRSGGVVANGGFDPPPVPRFEADGRTMLGTGFREATFDLRAVRRVRPTLRVVGALYGYRQYDAPRTDQCPPPEAPIDECLTIAEQFRTLGYVALRGDAGPYVQALDLQAAFQLHEELRVNDRPRSFVRSSYDDRIATLQAALRAQTRPLPLGDGAEYGLRYGLDASRDEVGSQAVQTLTDPALLAIFEPSELRTVQPRGQYVEGSTYASAGAFAELWLTPWSPLTLRGGGRLSAIGANAPPEPITTSRAVSERFVAAVGRAGAELRAHQALRLQLNYDQGFRAPNLDDLTSRQQAGPGFQIENEALTPERTHSFELGALADPGPLALEAWAFATLLEDGITRSVREASDCPPQTPACSSSRNQYQLVNADGTAHLLGTEGVLVLTPFGGASLRATAAYAFGEGPNTGSRSVAGRTPFGARVPLSRVPPLNGTLEARYLHRDTGLYGAFGLRWALAQDRLAPSDLSDPRIPDGGTPGYGVLDLRAGYRYAAYLRVHVVLENLLDTAYRVHGSSVNGPGRGLTLGAALRL
jgi:outer membrane receptor protein involved in Fe transport